MDTPTLLNKPSTKPVVVSKVTKISNLSTISTKARKSSTKLRKIFETNSYQKRTQLSVLNRYKRRLDAIDKQNEKRLEKKKKDKSKGILPKIKPFVGTFFKANADPLKSIAQLAAFNAATKLAKGDVLGTVGPGLTAAAILFGPKLLKMGGSALLKGITKSADIAKAPAAETKTLRSGERAAAKGIGEAAEGGGRGGIRFLGPIVDTALAAWDFQSRKSAGQTNLQAGLGAGAGAAGAWAGFSAGAALGAAIGSAFFGVGSVPGAVIGAVVGGVGAWLGSSLAGGVMDMITGADRKTSATGGSVSFAASLDKYETVVNKFSSYAFSSGGGGGGGSGELIPGEAQQVGQYQTGTMGGQQYGDPRPGRKHAGVDLDLGPGAKQVTFLGGTVNYIGNNPGGYYTFVDIMTPTGYIERLAELGQLAPGIKVGARVAPGQVISVGEGPTGVTHLEYRRPGTSGFSGTVNPLEFLKTQKVMSGSGTMNYKTAATPSASSPPPSSPPPRQRSVASYTSYAPSPYAKSEIIPLPIPQQMMQQMTQSSSSESMMMPGPSEQELLNSFYKRVLLNTVS